MPRRLREVVESWAALSSDVACRVAVTIMLRRGYYKRAASQLLIPHPRSLAALCKLPFFLYLCAMKSKGGTRPDTPSPYAQWAIEFTVVAREFCEHLANPAEQTSGQLTEWLHAFLPLLYYKAARIPTRPEAEEEYVPQVLTEPEYEMFRLRLAELLGHNDEFAGTGLCSERDVELVGPNPALSEVLADIYQYLYDFLALYRGGDEKRMWQALGYVQATFLSRWGGELLIALRWLRVLLAEEFRQILEEGE